jgi:hypothetical protein
MNTTTDIREKKSVTVFNRWTRSAAAVRVSGAVLGVALFGVPAAAHAQGITNPAQHPAPITVTIDGQTYHDGLDTLPGYDDYACTPIPKVQYDFPDDQIQYYNSDGDLIDTADWTEWSRISSYQTWVDQQQAGSPSSTLTSSPSSTSAPTPSPSTTSPASTSPATTSPAGTSPASTSPATKKTSSTTKTSSPATKNTSSTPTPSPSSQSAKSSPPKEATSSHAGKSGTSTVSSTNSSTPAAGAAPAVTGAPAGGAVTEAPAASNAPPAGVVTSASSGGTSSPAPVTPATTKYKLASARTGVGGGEGDTRLAGAGILAVLAALAGFTFLFGLARRSAFGRL